MIHVALPPLYAESEVTKYFGSLVAEPIVRMAAAAVVFAWWSREVERGCSDDFSHFCWQRRERIAVWIRDSLGGFEELFRKEST